MRAPGRSPWPVARLLAAASLLACLAGCLSDAGENTRLVIRNPEITAGLDSLDIRAVGASGEDTVVLHRWRDGETMPSELPAPAGWSEPYDLLTQGYKGGFLVYRSRTRIEGGRSRAPVREFRMVAPVLAEVPESRSARAGEKVVLAAAWKTRPGIVRQADSGEAGIFTPEGEFAWVREGRVIGTDTVLALDSLTPADSGAYLFTAGNPAGRDSLAFHLAVRHMLPRIAPIGPQAALAGRRLTVIPAVTHSDSLLYRWSREGLLRSRDSVLALDTLRPTDTGTWQLTVSNAGDTTEQAVSNPFEVAIVPDPGAAWNPEKTVAAGAQAHSSLGTALDLDVARAMFHSEAAEKEALIDLLFVHSGGALKLMSAYAAKRAADLTYADAFEDAKIKDIQMVKASAKPATPAAGRAAYEAGAKASAFPAEAGQGFLARTTDGYIAWIKVKAIHNGSTSSSSADLIVAIGAW